MHMHLQLPERGVPTCFVMCAGVVVQAVRTDTLDCADAMCSVYEATAAQAH